MLRLRIIWIFKSWKIRTRARTRSPPNNCRKSIIKPRNTRGRPILLTPRPSILRMHRLDMLSLPSIMTTKSSTRGAQTIITRRVPMITSTENTTTRATTGATTTSPRWSRARMEPTASLLKSRKIERERAVSFRVTAAIILVNLRKRYLASNWKSMSSLTKLPNTPLQIRKISPRTTSSGPGLCPLM